MRRLEGDYTHFLQVEHIFRAHTIREKFTIPTIKILEIDFLPLPERRYMHKSAAVNGIHGIMIKYNDI